MLQQLQDKLQLTSDQITSRNILCESVLYLQNDIYATKVFLDLMLNLILLQVTLNCIIP